MKNNFDVQKEGVCLKNNIPKSIQNKMHRLAKLSAEASRLSGDIDDWFIKHGYNVDETTSGDSLRSGSGLSLEELEYGNDITDEFCEAFQNGEFENCKSPL